MDETLDLPQIEPGQIFDLPKISRGKIFDLENSGASWVVQLKRNCHIDMHGDYSYIFGLFGPGDVDFIWINI